MHDAKAIWETLVNVYEQSDTRRLALLMDEFFDKERKVDKNIDVYVSEMANLFADLNQELKKESSAELPIHLLHHRILRTAGIGYTFFRSLWSTLKPEERTTEMLTDHLKSIERETSAVVSNESDAFMASHKSQEKVNEVKEIEHSLQRNEESGTCHICGSKNHFKRHCPQNEQSKGYGSKGHQKRQGKYGAQNKGPWNGFAATEKKSESQLRMWVCDSGATQHMTSRNEYFQEYKNFPSPVAIYMADCSSVQACGSGKITHKSTLKDLGCLCA